MEKVYLQVCSFTPADLVQCRSPGPTLGQTQPHPNLSEAHRNYSCFCVACAAFRKLSGGNRNIAPVPFGWFKIVDFLILIAVDSKFPNAVHNFWYP